MKEKLVNMAWALGVRGFRLTRKANLSSRLEPAFTRLAALAPNTTQAAAAALPNGAQLWMPAGYRDVRTVATGLFQRDETRLLTRLTLPDMTFVDIGAYVGYFTILASGWVGRGGHVYAFEPDGLAFEYLVRNIETNDCVNAVAINKAASDSTSTATLIRDPMGPETFVTTSRTQGQAFVVDTITLDKFFEGENWPTVDVVKMNIEGSELSALRGMKEVSRRSPRLQLVMEFNQTALERAGVNRHDLATTLAELGFRHACVVERDLAPIPSGELLPMGRAVYNLLLTK